MIAFIVIAVFASAGVEHWVSKSGWTHGDSMDYWIKSLLVLHYKKERRLLLVVLCDEVACSQVRFTLSSAVSVIPAPNHCTSNAYNWSTINYPISYLLDPLPESPDAF